MKFTQTRLCHPRHPHCPRRPRRPHCPCPRRRCLPPPCPLPPRRPTAPCPCPPTPTKKNQNTIS